MRAARLIRLLLLLQNRGGGTAAELAAELGVSPRTVARDVAELGEAGIPVYARQGRGGGYRLLDGFRTRLTGMGRSEVEALLLSAAPQALRGLGLDAAGTAARLKLAAAVPFAGEALRSVSSRFHLDVPGWFRDYALPGPLPELAGAVWNDRVVSVRYRPGRRLTADREPGEVERRLEPYGLVLKAGVWYLVAATESLGPQRFRVYRVDRFVEVAVTCDGFDRDPDVDLADFWRDRARRFAEELLTQELVVRVSPVGIRRMRDRLTAPAVDRALAAAEPPDADGWVRTMLPVESWEVAHDELLSLAGEVEVLEPEPVRRRMIATVRRLAGLYGPEAPTTMGPAPEPTVD